MFRWTRAFVWFWALWGCAEQPITFETQADTVAAGGDVSMNDVSSQDDDSSEEDGAGASGPGGDDPSGPEPTPGPEPLTEAGAPPPPVDEFDLGRPRGVSAEVPWMSVPNPSCDGGRCSCLSDFDCSPPRPTCDWVNGGVCVQCLSFQDCQAFAFGDERLVCETGECRPCSDVAQCPRNGNVWECREGSCVEFCNGNRDCSPGWFCEDGICANGEVLPPDQPD